MAKVSLDCIMKEGNKDSIALREDYKLILLFIPYEWEQFLSFLSDRYGEGHMLQINGFDTWILSSN